MEPLELLTVAAGLVQLTQIGPRLESVESAIKDNALQLDVHLDEFHRCCRDVNNLIRAIAHGEATVLEAALQNSLFNNFNNLLRRASASVNKLNQALQYLCHSLTPMPTPPDIPDEVLDSFAKKLEEYYEHHSGKQKRSRILKHRLTDDSSDEEWVKKRCPQRLQRFLRSHFGHEKELQQWRSSTQSSIAVCWRDHDLPSKLAALPVLRGQLNTELLWLLNSQQKASHLSADTSQARSPKSDGLRSGQEIIEVLSVNRDLSKGLTAVAAVLTCSNGEAYSIASPGVRNGTLIANQPGTLIRYSAGLDQRYNDCVPFEPAENHIDHEAGSESSDEGSEEFFDASGYLDTPSDAQDLAVAAAQNAYGSVAVSGHASAHLGDTNVHGPVNIQNLVVFSGDKEVKQSFVPLLSSNFRLPVEGLTSIPVDHFETNEPQTIEQIRILSSSDAVDVLLEALSFREEGYRKDDIKEAHHNTFRWIFESNAQHSNFASWLTKGQSCFWINGKAGSGKSTLMKYVLSSDVTRTCLRQWSKGKILISANFFFWHAGTNLQKSYDGILRSLIRQILYKQPHLGAILFPKLWLHLLTHKNENRIQISRSELEGAAETLVRKMPPDLAMFIMIDGVDEYSGDHFEFCRFLMRLGSCHNVKILVSSRPIPICHQFFSQFPSFRLQDLTTTDIRAYIDTELGQNALLLEMEEREEGFAKTITDVLTEKASGVFLWITLVVKELLIGLGNYDDRQSLLERVDKLPSDLEDLYDHMFAQLSIEYQREAAKLLQLTLRAVQIQAYGMSTTQLHFADRAEYQYNADLSEPLMTKSDENKKAKEVEGRLRSRCCGLIEVNNKDHHGRTHNPIIKFLHRTVVEYLCLAFVFQRLQELYPVTFREIDLILLTACTCTLRSLDLRPSRAIEDDRAAQLMQDCLRYSLRLEKQGDSSYVKYLLAADSHFLQLCTRNTKDAPGLSVYNDLYDRFEWHSTQVCGLWHHSVSRQLSASITDRDSTEITFLSIAYGGLIAFLEAKLQIEKFSQSSKDRVLCLLIELHHKSILGGSDLEAVLGKILHFANPNAVAVKVDNQMRLEAYYRAAARLSPSRDDNEITSWNFWLSQLTEEILSYETITGPKHSQTTTFLNITLAFLRAGADTYSTHLPKVNVLNKLYHDMVSRKQLSNDMKQEASVVDEIIKYLARGAKAGKGKEHANNKQRANSLKGMLSPRWLARGFSKSEGFT